MAAGVGLDRQRVIEEAAALADEEGSDTVTLAALAARLGVRSQSLYAHIDGLDGLRRDLAVLGQQSLAGRLGRAVMGRAGEDALRALCDAYARFAAERPGLYACSQRAPAGTRSSSGRATRPRSPGAQCCSRSVSRRRRLSTSTERSGPRCTAS